MPYVREPDFARLETIIRDAVDTTTDEKTKDLLRRALEILEKYKTE